MTDGDLRARWAASGAMALTGDAGGPPLVAPDGVVRRVAALGDRVGVDALALLGERAAMAGLARRGATSCGGATRLLRAGDGRWLALALARPEDVELLPAWFGGDVALPSPASAAPAAVRAALPGPDVWAAVSAAVASRRAGALVDRARLLGLPVALLGEHSPGPDSGPAGVVARRYDGGRARATAGPGWAPGRAAGVRVVDLSSLWAGPVCAHLLGLAGADVVKVESTGRPDGARRGPVAFYDLLHAGHRSVALDLASAGGREALARLVRGADVVVEASRPRALRQMGIEADSLLRAGEGPRVWVSLTGHGRAGGSANAVAFGDDAAVAGGLVAWGADGGPRFVADAVADPLSGLAAAAAALDALAAGGRWMLDVAMAAVAAHIAGPVRSQQSRARPPDRPPDEPPDGPPDRPPNRPWIEGTDAEAAPPRARPAAAEAALLGADTADVVAAAPRA